MRVMLPCFKCKEHYKTILSFYKLQKYKKPQRKHLMKSIYDIHELVNRDLGKPAFSYKNINKLYEKVDHDKIFKFIEICVNDLPEVLSMNDLEHIRIFFYSLQHIFPCEGCRQRLKQMIRNRPMNFTNKEDVMHWYFQIKDKWESNHISPRNYLLIQFKNSNHLYITQLPYYNIQKINHLFYQNGKLFANIALGKKNSRAAQNMTIPLFQSVNFEKNHEIKVAKLKNTIDLQTLIRWNELNAANAANAANAVNVPTYQLSFFK